MYFFDKPTFFIFLFFALAIPLAGAQTLYTIEGTAPSVGEFVGRPAGPLGYPNGPVLKVFPVGAGGGVGPILPFAPPPGGRLGDVAVDHDDDRIWATDGIVFSRFDQNGAMDDQFVLPAGWPPMTGLGCDSVNDRLWVTDGFQAAAVSSPGGAPWIAVVDIGPFPLWGWPIGIAQDIEWDPCSGTLWVVTNAGELANFFIGGGAVPGGFSFPFMVGPNLTGLGYDTGNQTFFVTDGSIVVHVDRFGMPAAPTFYFPDDFENVFPGYGVPAPLSGLAFSLRPVTYGEGHDPVGGPPVPAISGYGQSCSPNPTFGFRLEGATPASLAFAVLGIDYLCPPMMNLYVLMPFFWISGPNVVGVDGTASQPLGITDFGCGPPIGLTLYAQWVIQRPAAAGGGLEMSEGLSFTLGCR